MFGTNDRTSLTGINVINRNKKVLGYVLEFPFNDKELELPKDMVKMTIFEHDSGYANFGHEVFKICVGGVTTLDEINNNPELERLEFFPGVFDDLEGTYDKIFYFLDDTGKKILFSKVNTNDIVVRDIDELKYVLTRISDEYRTIKAASARLKNCGVRSEAYTYPKIIDGLSKYAESYNLEDMHDEIKNEAKKKVKVYLDTVRNMKKEV